MQKAFYNNSENDSLLGRFSFINAVLIFCVFVLVCSDSAFYLVNTQEGTVRMLIDLFAIIVLLLLKGRVSFAKGSTTVMAIMVSVSLIFGIFTLEIKQTIIIIAAITIGWLFANAISYTDFKEFYMRIMLFLTVFSLIAFVISIVAPQLIRILPFIQRREGGSSYYNALFSVICDSTYVSRNYGIFWEPGAFSIFLNIALFIELFQRKASIKNIAVLSIAILSTLSTLGIACMLVLAMAYLSQKQSFVKKGIKNFILFLITCFVVYLVVDGEYFMFHVLGKLTVNNGNISSTTSVRMDAFTYMGKAFLSSPLWGVGYPEFLRIQEEFCSNMATFTLVNFLATFGVICGLFPTIGCVKFFKNGVKGFIAVLAMFLFTVLIFSTENFMQITFLYILMFYGFNNREAVYEDSIDCN